LRIFNERKDLLKEIRFPQEITSVLFMNKRGDLLVAHNTKVSTLPVEDLGLEKVDCKNYPCDVENLKAFYKSAGRLRDLTFWNMMASPSKIQSPDKRPPAPESAIDFSSTDEEIAPYIKLKSS